MKTYSSIILLSLTASSALGAISFTGSDINQNFTGYDGLAGPGGWDVDPSAFSAGGFEPRGSSSGGVGTGGTYAFDIGGGNIALGVQPIGSDFTPGYYQLQITNDSSATVSSWSISFKGFSYNDQGRANTLAFSYSTNGTDFVVPVAGGFTSVETADGMPTWVEGVNYGETLPASVAVGSSLFLRWTGDDSSGSGSRDEFAIDDVLISAVPEPSSALLSGLALLGLLRRRR